MATSDQALQDLQNFNSSAANPTDVLAQADNKYGIGQSRQRLVGLRSAIMGTEGLLNNVASDVQGRTARSSFGEAATNRLIANERAPIAEQYNQQQGALTNENASLSDLQGQSAKEAQMTLAGQDTKRNSLQAMYDTLYKREQDTLAAQRAEQARQDALAEVARQRAAAMQGMGWSGGGGGSSSGGGGGGGSGGGSQVDLNPIYNKNTTAEQLLPQKLKNTIGNAYKYGTIPGLVYNYAPGVKQAVSQVSSGVKGLIKKWF